MEVINSDHYAFLPLRYVLNNVFLTRETIDKVRCSKQDSILLKLEDGVASEFVDMVKLFFQDVESCHSPQW
jgi:hypothetical protein